MICCGFALQKATWKKYEALLDTKHQLAQFKEKAKEVEGLAYAIELLEKPWRRLRVYLTLLQDLSKYGKRTNPEPCPKLDEAISMLFGHHRHLAEWNLLRGVQGLPGDPKEFHPTFRLVRKRANRTDE